MGDVELVTIYHAGLERHDRVTPDAARAMIPSGWEIVADLPVEAPAVPVDTDPDELVALEHTELGRRCVVPAGAARALTTHGGWTVADPEPEPEPVDVDDQALLAELAALTPEQLADMAELADAIATTDPDPTTED